MSDELFYVFKFRPSGHSDDYSLFATFQSEKDAIKAQKAVERLLEDMTKNPDKYRTDWSPDEVELSVGGDMVTLRLNTAGYLEEVEAALSQDAKPQKLECHANYQEISVSVRVPKDLTLQTAILVLGQDEARAIHWFMEHVGSPEVAETTTVGEQVFTWVYAGDEIYSDGCLYLGFDFMVGQKDNWTVEE